MYLRVIIFGGSPRSRIPLLGLRGTYNISLLSCEAAQNAIIGIAVLSLGGDSLFENALIG